MKRRDFLKYSSLVSASAWVPHFLQKQTARFLNGKTGNGRVLVVIQWSGGNDGLNTVVPFRNDVYFESRPAIALAQEEVYELNDELGLHSKLEGLVQLYDQGEVAILNNVGYPNPNRSHFRSMDIWQTASRPDQYLDTGWIGRLLDAQCPDCKPYQALEIDDTLSLALKGSKLKGLAVRNPQALHKHTSDRFLQSIANSPLQARDVDSHPQLAYLHKTLVETSASAAYVYEKSKVFRSPVVYPFTGFGQQLKTIAQLIVANSETQVYYVSMSGFDTHISQPGAQARLLEQYAQALKVFAEDLKRNGRFEDTLIMTFSEFGRRVAQNASRGTDHGTANNLFLVSGGLKKPGIFNEGPNLLDLDEGDLKYTLDFRQVYATVLERWLQVDADEVLGERFSPLEVL